MAGNTVKITFVGEDRDFRRAVANVISDSDRMDNRFTRTASAALGVVGAFAKIGASSSAVTTAATTVATLGSVMTAVAPAALALPGILAGIGVAAGTLKIGLTGVSDALTGDQEAFDRLAPSAQGFVASLRGMSGEYDRLRTAVQQRLFAGLDGEVRQTGQTLLTLGQNQLPAVAAGFNGMAVSALQAARTPFFTGSLTAIVGNTAAALANMRNTVANLLTGFTGLGSIGSQLLPQLGTAVDNVSARFAAWVQEGVRTGTIEASIRRALDTLRQLGAFVGEVIATFGTLFTTISQGMGTSAQPVQLLIDKVKMVHAALQSPEGQTALRMLGEAIAAVSAAFNAVLPHVLSFVFALAQQALPVITSFANFVAEHSQMFAGLVIGIAGLVAGIKVATTVIGIVRGAMAAWAAAQVALNIVMAANPIGLVVVAIGLLVAAVVGCYQHFEGFRNVVDACWAGVKAAFNAGVEAVRTAATAVVNFVRSIPDGVRAALAWFDGLGQMFTGWWNSALDAVRRAGAAIIDAVKGLVGGTMSAIAGLALLPVRVTAYFVEMVTGGRVKAEDLVNLVKSLPGRILSALGNLGSLLYNAGASLLNGLWEGVKSMTATVTDKIKGVLTGIRDMFPFSPAKTGPFSGKGYTLYSGKALMSDFGKGIEGVDLGPITATALQGAKVTATGTLGQGVTASAGLGGQELQLKVAPGADSALASMLMNLVRTGQLQLVKAA